jgi:beta-barrel assembly-enhancing protease
LPCRSVLLFLLAWLSLCPHLKAQSDATYTDLDPCQPLEAVGPIPRDFLLSFSEMYQAAEANIRARFPRQAMLQQAYYRESLYYTHRLLLSGRVLFQDSVSRYIAAVADRLLRNRPELRAELRFYAVRSSAVNAFATGHGIILVNLGLIAHLDNEAQLAFILSHEIAHYVKQHSLRIFLQSREEGPNHRSLEKAAAIEALLIRQNLYSRDAESEADRWGTWLYLSSGYDLDAIAGAFRILQRADRPFAEKNLDLLSLLPAGVHLQADWLSPAPATPEPLVGHHPEAASTHPAPQERRAAILAQIKDIPTGGRPTFLVGESRFRYVRDCARYATCKLYLNQRQYEYALLGLQQLSQRYGRRPCLLRFIAYAWYGLARHANAGRYYDVHQPYFHLQDDARQLAWLTEQLTPAELNTIALLAAWEGDRLPDAGNLAGAMLRELGQDLLAYHLPVGDTPSPSWRPSLSMQPGLMAWLDRLAQSSSDTLPPQVVLPADRRQLSAEQRKQLLEGVDLNLDHVVFVNPGYQQIDERLLDPLKYVASEKRRQRFARKLDQYATRLHISHTLLDVEALTPSGIQHFRDLMLLNDWLSFYDNLNGVSMLSPAHDAIHALCERQGTPYFAWINCYAFTRYRVGKPLVLAAGFLFPPLFPYSMYYVFSPRYDTVLYVQVYDLAHHTHRLIYPRVIRMRDRADVVNGHLYDLLSQFD